MANGDQLWDLEENFFFSTIDGVDTNDGFRGFGEQWVLVFRWRGYVFQGWVFILWCRMVFSRVSFSFSHHSSNTPVAAICFWHSSFFTYGFWEGGRKKNTKGVMFTVECIWRSSFKCWDNSDAVVCWWAQGDEVACNMWKLCKKLWERVWHQNYPLIIVIYLFFLLNIIW